MGSCWSASLSGPHAPVLALGTSVFSPPLEACLQENFLADLGGWREGGARLLPSNLDSWVYGRKCSEADAVIMAIPEAAGRGRERSPPLGWSPTSLYPSARSPSLRNSAGSSALDFLLLHSILHSWKPEMGSYIPRVTQHIGTQAELHFGSPLCHLWSSPGLQRESRHMVSSFCPPLDPRTLFPESPSPYIPEMSGQSLARAMAGGADPTQGSRPGQQPGPEHLPPVGPILVGAWAGLGSAMAREGPWGLSVSDDPSCPWGPWAGAQTLALFPAVY